MTSSMSYAVDSDGIVTLTIDQPGKSMNVIGQDFVDEFEAAIERAVGDASVKGIIVTSGKSSFIAGADLIGMESLIAHARTAPPAESLKAISRLTRVCAALRPAASPLPARSTARRLAAASRSRSPAITASAPMAATSSSACLKSRSGSFPAPAERSACLV